MNKRGGIGHAARVTWSGAALETDNLSRSFGGRPAVDGLTFDVQAGEVVALLGPNGAGKTTTVRLLNGVLKPDSGECRVLGLDPSVSGDEVRRRTGVITETSGLDERLTGRENVLCHARIRGIAPAHAGREADRLLERLGIADRANELVRGFSTGQRKRIALARALVHRPDVLFLDEPTAGLDPEAARDTVDLVDALAHEHGRTIVLCTHDLAEAGRLCRRMAVLRHGRLVAFGTPDALAAQFWQGLAVEIDLGAPAPSFVVLQVQELPGVLAAEASGTGLQLRLESRQVIPAAVAALTGQGLAIYGVLPRPATLEDVYFAVTGYRAQLSDTPPALEPQGTP
jgi:ABC-2 type transport system ATP-binding protein